MKSKRLLFVGLLLICSACSAQDASSTDNNIAELQTRIDEANANVDKLADELQAAKSAGKKSEQIDFTGQLSQAVRTAFDLQTELQLAQLTEAETKIAASRRHIAERQQRVEAIVGKRFEALVNIPAHAQSPQAVLDAMERFTAAKDYEGVISLLTDDEADRMAGVLLQSGSMMNAMLALMATSTQPIEDTEQIRSIIASSERFMRPDPPAEALAALQQIANILPSVFYELGATSNGEPLERPTLTAEEYATLLRTASGVLTDSRAYSTAMMKAASDIEDDSEEPSIPSQWKIDLDGVHAVAIQTAHPVDRTTNQTARVELKVEAGHWKISKLVSDEEMMSAFAGPGVLATPTKMPSTVNSGQNAPPAQQQLTPPPATSSLYATGKSAAALIKEQMQGRWIVESISEGDSDGLAELPGPLEIDIAGDIMRHYIGTQLVDGSIHLVDRRKTGALPSYGDATLPIDFVHDPNGKATIQQGIIACDGETLSICMSMESATAEDNFRPQLFVAGSKVYLYKCRRKNEALASLPELLQGRWRVNLFTGGGAPSILHGRFVDPENELAVLSDSIPHEELLAGPWILEIENDNVTLRHGPSGFPYMSLDVTGEADNSFAVAIPQSALDSPLAAFSRELKDQKIGGRYKIEDDKLTLCMSERKTTTDKVKLAPTADTYFECVRENQPHPEAR